MSTDIFIRYFLHLHADIAIIGAKGVCKFMAYDNDLIAGKLRRWEKYLERYRLPAVERFIEYMKQQARQDGLQAERETDSKNVLKIYLKDIVNF